MNEITAIIPTYNEAHNIEEAIKSVRWCDEIIVVDSFSTDNTIDLAAANGAKILQREYENSASQKNWAIPQAKHEWIFLLDADERADSDLVQEIQNLLSRQIDLAQAYWIKRRNFFMEQEIKYSGWQGDRVIRFFRRDLCRYEEKKVHAEVICDGKVGQLKGRISHNTYKDMDHFLAKMERYAEWSANDHLKKTRRVTFYHLQLKPLVRFLRHYIIQLGFLDGKVGYKISKIMAWGVKRRYEKLEEILKKG